MNYKKVLLLNPVAHEKNAWSTRAVLRAGLGYIAQSLHEAGIEYAVLDFALGYSRKDLFKKIKNFKPDLLAASLFTYKYEEAYSLLNAVRKKIPGLRIVCGGPHLTTFKEEAMKACPAIDFALTFEGEGAIKKLCSGTPLEEIPGLIFRSGSSLKSNQPAPFETDLDSIPFPQYRGFELENYPVKNSPPAERIIPIVSSRGCPYNCVYCTVQTVMGKRFRARSVDNVVSEISWWYKKGYRKFSFVDDNFTLVRSRVLEFCQKIKKENLKDLYLLLHNGIRADKMDAELLLEMRKTGFAEIGIGVEASDDRILKLLQKNEKLETVEKAVKEACEAGFAVDLYFIVGAPGETPKDAENSAKLAVKYPVNNVFFFNLIPYPKTPLFDWVRKNGSFIYPPEYFLNKVNSSMNKPVFETPEFSGEERKKSLIAAKKTFEAFKTARYAEKFVKAGVPVQLAAAAAALYSLRPVQILFNDSKILKKIKGNLWQKNSSR